jgi:pilus assembly protein Flp/PilA
MSMFRKFVQDDSGATAIEYGLIAALVSVAIIAALGTLGDNLNNTFTAVSNNLSTPRRRSKAAGVASAASRPPMPSPTRPSRGS